MDLDMDLDLEPETGSELDPNPDLETEEERDVEELEHFERILPMEISTKVPGVETAVLCGDPLDETQIVCLEGELDTSNCICIETEDYDRIAEAVEGGHGVWLRPAGTSEQDASGETEGETAEMPSLQWSCVTGTVRSPENGNLLGFCLRDGGDRMGSASHYMPLDDMRLYYRMPGEGDPSKYYMTSGVVRGGSALRDNSLEEAILNHVSGKSIGYCIFGDYWNGHIPVK